MANKKKNNKKRNNNNNQNKNYAKKKEKILQTDGDFFETMKNIEKEAIKEIEEETNTEKKVEEKRKEEKIEAPEEVKVEIKEDVKETEKVEDNEKDKKENKAFNRRFWIDVILLLLIFIVIGVLFCQIMSNSIEKEIDTTTTNVVDYEIKNSSLDMSIEEFKDTLKADKLNVSIFSNLESKDVNEEGKDEGIFYYQGLLGEDNVVGITTKEENEEIISIDFISRRSNTEYQEDFKRIIEKTLYSSGIEKNNIETIINKFENREKLDKTYNNIRIFMDYSSKDFYVTKIIYNRRLATSLKSIYSQEVSDLIGEID